MRAGKLRRRVVIQVPAELRGTNGESEDSWTPLASIWAGFEAVAVGADRVAADQRTAVQQRLCRIRYRSGITPKLRLVDGANAYEIVDVADADNRTELILTLKSIEAASRG